MTDDPNRARRQIRLLHVSLADRKFVAGMQRFFDVPEASNRWAWVAWNRQEEPGLREEFGDDLIGSYDDLKKPEGRTYRLLEEEAERAEVVVFHYVDLRLLSLVRSLSRKKTLVGSTWGGDYAPHLIRPSAMYSPQTLEWLNRQRRGLRRFVNAFGMGAAKRARSRKKYIKLLECCDLVVWGLGDIESGLLGEGRAARVPSSQWKVDYYMHSGERSGHGDVPLASGSSSSIVLGNSATPSGNHLDALGWLPYELPKDAKLIMPLSYGSEPYARQVVEAAMVKYGASAQALTSFMDLESYEGLIAQAGYMALANYRAQAMGALRLALRFGLTPILLRGGQLHTLTRRLGIESRTFEHIASRGLKPLSVAQKARNRELAPLLVGDSAIQQQGMRDWLGTVT